MFYRLLGKYPSALVIKEATKTKENSMYERMKADIAKEKKVDTVDENIEHIEL